MSAESQIQKLRAAAGINQKTIAERLKLSISQYSRIERNPDKATLVQLRAIASVLGVPLARLLENYEEVTLADGITITRLYLSLPVLEYSEVANLGAIKRDDTREYLAPAQNLSADCYWTKIKTNENAPKLEKGDKACWSPSERVSPGDVVIAVDSETGAVSIGQYYPLPTSNPDAPGFIIQPVATPQLVTRFTVSHPGKVQGRLMERRQTF